MSRYEYDSHIEAEIDRMVRGFFARGSRIERTDRPADYAGVDYIYHVNHHCPVAVRHRADRPPLASRIDITWRSTEPVKMRLRTYAPIALFVWSRKGLAVAGRGVDVYRMFDEVMPALENRPTQANGDGTSFLTVDMAELDRCDALLRIGDRDHWITVPLDGDARIEKIVHDWRPGALPRQQLPRDPK